MTIYLTAPSLISSFRFLVEKKPTTAVVSDIFAADLNGDGIQEAIFLGRQSQPATIQTWSNSTIHIFQASAGGWVDATLTMLPDNVIVGAEPSLLFGDFNNDGKLDFFVPSDTDMQYLVPSYLFTNTGSTFTKQAFDFQTWAHGAYAADVNQDGYLDVLSTDYGPRAGIGFGGPGGFTYKSNDRREGFGFTSSDISAADFMGDGTVTILVSDNVDYPAGTGLFRWNINSQEELTFQLISTLPMPRFELPKWDYMNFNPGDGSIPKRYLDDSHDVRVVPFNFSGDALMDAIVMSRPAYTNGTWPEYSEIQFLLNKGKGVFEDVTDSKLVGYNNASNVSYQPIFLDVNRDGRTDIFIGSPDFFANYNSTAVLLQQPNGTFIEAGRDAFSNLWQSAVTSVQSANLGYVIADWGQSMQLVKGLNGKISVLGSVCYQTQGGMSNMVFTSDLSFGNMSFDEYITSSAGNDTLDGGAGTDTAMFSGNRVSYTISKSSTDLTVSSTAEGVDTLANIERLKFADTAIAFDTSGVGGQTYRVYKAAFNRTPDLGGLGFWISGMDGGESLNAVAQGFVNSAEFKSVYGASPTNAQIVTRFYDNVLGRAAESGGYNYWLGVLNSGQGSVAGVLAAFSESPENQAAVIGVIGNGILYTPYG